jgi:LmbE family N-acetylglucosaminyl deacetylase
MKKQKTLIFFGAHPDDESFGPGSTLAHYVLKGARVYVVCSTGGEAGTVEPRFLEKYKTIKELRAAELKCAGKALGLTGVIFLGYRDSGMEGSEDNKHPEALAIAPLEEVTARIVKIMRELKPDVVITHDAGGGYGHPDHVATHLAVFEAMHAAGDKDKFQKAGPPFQPGKLYFYIRPAGSMRIMVKLMPLFGQDPHHFGRNKDIDLTKRLVAEYPVNAIIRPSKEAVKMHRKAALCHDSQGGGRPRQGAWRIMQIIDGFSGPKDYFMRSHPAPTDKYKEKDLFEGIE